jgi:hypothetical protein
MSVDSYLELFTTLFGWSFYGVLWDALVATGIVYLPFLGILIDHWRGSAERAELGVAAPNSLRSLEIDLFLALLVVVLAGQPAALTPLNASTLSYTPPPTLANPSPPTASPSASQSTFGATGFSGSPGSVNLPIWWYAVLSTSAGLNHAVVEGLPSASSWRAVEQQARLATVTDPRLRQEASQFFSECFVPARSKFQQSRPDGSAIAAQLAANGDTDPEWLGSHVYRQTPGYYDTLRAATAVQGWAFDSRRDTEYDPAAPPQAGRPTCKQWWEDTASGLRQKLISEGDATSGGLSGLVVALAPGLASESQKDTVVKTILNNAPAVWSSNDLAANNTATTGIIGTAANFVKGGLAAGGVVTASALLAVGMTVMLQALPMIQALILLGIYALLPLIIVLSRYSIEFLITGALAIFTVKFWSVLWYVAMWVDQNLIQSMYPDVNIFLLVFTNPGEHDSKRLLLNMLTTVFYLGLPLLWSGMMAWVGMHAGRALDATNVTLTKPVNDAASRGGRLGEAIVARKVR